MVGKSYHLNSCDVVLMAAELQYNIFCNYWVSRHNIWNVPTIFEIIIRCSIHWWPNFTRRDIKSHKWFYDETQTHMFLTATGHFNKNFFKPKHQPQSQKELFQARIFQPWSFLRQSPKELLNPIFFDSRLFNCEPYKADLFSFTHEITQSHCFSLQYWVDLRWF